MPVAVAPVPTEKKTWPWMRPWWRPVTGQSVIFFWIILIHVTAVVGLLISPLPGWKLLLATIVLAWFGGIGTTVCYHRALAHRALRLHPVVREILIFFAMFNGSGTPLSWTANHRQHHATADTPEDISSPRMGGFWWAHLRWLWQAGQVTPARYCRDLNSASYRVWSVLQGPLLAVSFLIGALFGWTAFFWLGAVRLVYALHGQCFVNSVCHLNPDAALQEDSSRNVTWLGFWHFFQGENWHRNHHARPGSARLGWTPSQVDIGWWVIVGLERLGLASEVHRPQRVND